MKLEKFNVLNQIQKIFQEKIDINILSIFEIYTQFSHLKNIYRKGWLEHGLSHEICESDADHSLGVAFLGVIIATKFNLKLNHEKLLKMAIIHDLAEIKTGDITPRNEIDYQIRKKQEIESITSLFSKFDPNSEFIFLFSEFELKSTPEGLFMKEIDTLEMLLQALIYEEETQIDLNDFFSSSNMKITHPVLMQIYHVLMQNRQKKIKVVNLNHKVKNKTNN